MLKHESDCKKDEFLYKGKCHPLEVDAESADIHMKFLKHSQPGYDDYDWDGKELTVYPLDKRAKIEKYDRKTLEKDGYLLPPEKYLTVKIMAFSRGGNWNTHHYENDRMPLWQAEERVEQLRKEHPNFSFHLE
jgi:hypothetical protein